MRIKSSKIINVSCFILCVSVRILCTQALMAQNETVVLKIGVLMDKDVDDLVGKVGLSCMNMALSDFYADGARRKTRLTPVADVYSDRDTLAAATTALNLVKNEEVQGILLGPSTSMQANFVTEIGEKAQVPIISFSPSTPTLTTTKSSYFFQATASDNSQVTGAISAIMKSFKWREAVPIYVDNEYSSGFVPSLMEALQEIDTRVPYLSAISPSVNDYQILEELSKLIRMKTRVFIVHMLPSLGSRLFTKAKEIGMMSEGFVWILSDGMTNLLNSMNSSVIDSMQGALGIKPSVPKTEKLENFRIRWKRKFHKDNPEIVDAELNIYGLRAYDATMALAMAIEKANRISNFGFKRANVSSNSTLGVSLFGPNLVRALTDIHFKGLGGDFHFVNQKLQSSAFQIVNVHGAAPTGVGFWTPEKGLVKQLKTSESSTSKTCLGTIIWPGDITSVPKGWEFPTIGKRLKVGIPSATFPEFVSATTDPLTNRTKATGYCIHVFDTVMKEIPVHYDYISYDAGTYDELVQQVFNGKFDAVVGDVTAIAKRSEFVDFTFPFLESEVSMLVPTYNDKNKNAVLFLKPLSIDLWVTTLCFFIFIAFVVWVLEHRINDEFRGSPSEQAGTSLWFAFSVMAFAHRERVINNLTRIVVIIWCFVLLILTQSFTASFSSLLTVERFHLSATSVKELIVNQEQVGYLNNSFVEGMLINLGFQKNKLKPYGTSEEGEYFLSLGSKNKGIAAAFDESPYLKLIMAKNCSKYTIVQPSTFMSQFSRSNIQQFKTGGLSFVFPKGSPLVAEISRAILKVTESDEMTIDDAWLSQQSKCPDHEDSNISSTTLDIDSFWGLFMISGAVSISALMIYVSMFVYAQREFLKGPEDSLWSKFLHLLRIFNQRDHIKTQAIRKNDQFFNGGNRVIDVGDVIHELKGTNIEIITSGLNHQT